MTSLSKKICPVLSCCVIISAKRLLISVKTELSGYWTCTSKVSSSYITHYITLLKISPKLCNLHQNKPDAWIA